MDSLSSISQYWPNTTTISSLLVLFVVIYLCSKSSKISSTVSSITLTSSNNINGKGVKPPHASGAFPVIGHLHKLIGGNGQPYEVLGSMADRYGPAFTIQFGTHLTLVLSNWEMVKECCTTNDKSCLNRPSFLVLKHILYDEISFGFGPYTPYWREMRKMSALHLLSNSRLEQIKSSIASEINASVHDLYQMCDYTKGRRESPVLVEMKTWFDDVMFNVVARVVVGKRNLQGEEGNNYKKAICEVRDQLATFAVTDVIPFLWWIDYVRGVDSSMKRTGKKIDAILVAWLEEHRQRRSQKKLSVTEAEANDHDEEDSNDFMTAILSIAEEGGIGIFGNDVDTVIKSICLDMMVGSDTTTITLTWALSLLLNNQHVLEKAREELDLNVGNERQVEESDLKTLVYLQAIFKETLRLYPPGPLTERSTTEDCNIGGFHVAAGTRLIINIWKVQRDPSVWPDPSEFRPERFLTKEYCHIDVRGQDFELIPFGSGRRMCPAVSFSFHLMFLTLARLIHGFNLMTTAKESTVDMSATPGFFNYKANHVHVLLSPRFESKFYGC